MESLLSGFRCAALLLVLLGASGCGTGVDESNFSPAGPGNPAADAPKTPEEADQRTLKTDL